MNLLTQHTCPPEIEGLQPVGKGLLGAIGGGTDFPALSRDFLLSLIQEDLARLDALVLNPVPFPLPLPRP